MALISYKGNKGGGCTTHLHTQLYMGQNTVLLHVRGGSKFFFFFLTDSHPNGHNFIRNINLGGQNY